MNSYIDLHCDTITMLHERKEDLKHNRRMVSISALQEGNALVQSFSAFVPTGLYPKPVRNFLTWRTFSRIADKKDRLLELHSGELFPVLSVEDIRKCRESGKVGALFTIEDAGVVGNRPERLEEAYRRGVRIASLTWNHENTLGYPNSPKKDVMKKGLKPFGLEMVEKMNELGMAVDVSHLSDGGFWDVARICRKPFIASHSNSRAMTGHPRNMTDEMIRALAEKGGVMGLNFAPAFLTEQGKESRIDDMVRHVLHIRDVGGSGVLALGSDFDGITGELEIDSPAKMPQLADALLKAGLTSTELDAMWSGNICRVFEAVWR
ncbi:MAG: dipeptidase [Lachnospiraceae bacterium]|nr:dipeptidase [Lachnospiraceae bacterium]